MLEDVKLGIPWCPPTPPPAGRSAGGERKKENINVKIRKLAQTFSCTFNKTPAVC